MFSIGININEICRAFLVRLEAIHAYSRKIPDKLFGNIASSLLMPTSNWKVDLRVLSFSRIMTSEEVIGAMSSEPDWQPANFWESAAFIESNAGNLDFHLFPVIVLGSKFSTRNKKGVVSTFASNIGLNGSIGFDHWQVRHLPGTHFLASRYLQA